MDVPLLTLQGEQIMYEKKHKFLGITLDAPKLTWKPHIDQLKASCQKRVSLLKSISHNHWGGDRKTILMLYKSLVRSKMDYGCQFYGNASDILLRELEPIQNQCLRIASGCHATTPIMSLQVETHVPPLIFRREELSLKYYCRIMELDPSIPTVRMLLDNRRRFDQQKSLLGQSHLLIEKWTLPVPSRMPSLPWSPIPILD